MHVRKCVHEQGQTKEIRLQARGSPTEGSRCSHRHRISHLWHQ